MFNTLKTSHRAGEFKLTSSTRYTPHIVIIWGLALVACYIHLVSFFKRQCMIIHHDSIRKGHFDLLGIFIHHSLIILRSWADWNLSVDLYAMFCCRRISWSGSDIIVTGLLQKTPGYLQVQQHEHLCCWKFLTRKLCSRTTVVLSLIFDVRWNARTLYAELKPNFKLPSYWTSEFVLSIITVCTKTTEPS